MKLTGADIVLECMIEQGVDTVFGYPGGTILNIYDSFYKYSDRVKHILTAHEQGAAHAADGYARSSGRVGVCFATSGPGATNLVTGIATAYMDSIPLVAITCNVPTNLLGKDSFQEVDIVGVTMPITKHNFLVKNAEDIADTIRKAFKIAASGRPGPVLVDITKDATAMLAEFEAVKPEKVERYKFDAENSELENVIKLIEESKRPLIYAGGGIISAGAADELARFRDLCDAPITLSIMGLGGFSAKHEAYTGMIGMHGTKTTSLAVKECDLIIAVGSRFSDRVVCNTDSFGRRAKIIHIDIDKAEIDKNKKTEFSLIGDAKLVLEALNKNLKQQNHDEWMSKIKEWKSTYAFPKPFEDSLSPRLILDTIYEKVGDETFVCTDVGQHQMWTAQFYPIEKMRHLVSSCGLGTMGFGLGAAIGTQVANPESTVINITGDGCFHMNLQELSTASKYELPIIEVIFNNNVLGMVRQWQKLFYEQRFSSTTLDKNTDYDMVSKGLGANAFTVTNKTELLIAIEKALESKNKPTVINCLIDKDENVLPMVPGGGSIEKPILEVEI
ncbi:MAG: biosynthetic-type acetolactate synthase large subunit [Oscillospiraceae bacterium]